MRVERERLLSSCSAVLNSRVLWPSAPLAPLAYADPRENVDRPHQKDMHVATAFWLG
jgi:hypothetical protein